jgi:3-oxoacyl-[acyl-carrier protein] reductase
MKLQGKKILVTGGASGLGRAMVDTFLGQGGIVIVVDQNSDALDDLARRAPVLKCYRADLSDPIQAENVLQQVHDDNGSMQALINNAGVIHSEPLVSIGIDGLKLHRLDNWKKTIAIDLDSVFYVTRLVVAEMVKNRIKGVVVNVSSIAAAGNAGQSAYAASKAALNALTVTWARELGPFGIRVAGLAPGFADTLSTRTALNQSILEHIRKEIPLKRLAKPTEVAQGALSILENDFYSGRIMEVDGGLRL